MRKILWVFLAVILPLAFVNPTHALTNYPNGVASYGIPVVPDDGYNIKGIRVFVDTTLGSNGNSGLSTDQAVKTITKALSLCTSGRGDTIYVFPGAYAETISITKDDVTIRGITYSELDGAVITGATNATATITITGDNVTLVGLKIDPYDAHGDMSVIDTTAAKNLIIQSCTITGGKIQVMLTNSDYSKVEDCNLLNVDDNDGGGANVKLVDADNCLIKANRIFNDCATGKVHGIIDNDSDNLIVVDNFAAGTGAATASTGAFVLITEASTLLQVKNNNTFYYGATIAEVSSVVAVHGLGTSDVGASSAVNGNYAVGCTQFFDTTGLTE